MSRKQPISSGRTGAPGIDGEIDAARSGMCRARQVTGRPRASTDRSRPSRPGIQRTVGRRQARQSKAPDGKAASHRDRGTAKGGDMPARGNAAGHRAAPSRDDGADGAHGPEDGARKKNLASPVAREIRGSSDAERSYEKRGRRGGIPPRRPRARARENGSSAVHRSAAPCSPTGFPRSTIGARRLSFRVRNGSGRAPPAMAADRWAALV